MPPVQRKRRWPWRSSTTTSPACEQAISCPSRDHCGVKHPSPTRRRARARRASITSTSLRTPPPPWGRGTAAMSSELSGDHESGPGRLPAGVEIAADLPQPAAVRPREVDRRRARAVAPERELGAVGAQRGVRVGRGLARDVPEPRAVHLRRVDLAEQVLGAIAREDDLGSARGEAPCGFERKCEGREGEDDEGPPHALRKPSRAWGASRRGGFGRHGQNWQDADVNDTPQSTSSTSPTRAAPGPTRPSR